MSANLLILIYLFLMVFAGRGAIVSCLVATAAMIGLWLWWVASAGRRKKRCVSIQGACVWMDSAWPLAEEEYGRGKGAHEGEKEVGRERRKDSDRKGREESESEDREEGESEDREEAGEGCKKESGCRKGGGGGWEEADRCLDKAGGCPEEEWERLKERCAFLERQARVWEEQCASLKNECADLAGRYADLQEKRRQEKAVSDRALESLTLKNKEMQQLLLEKIRQRSAWEREQKEKYQEDIKHFEEVKQQHNSFFTEAIHEMRTPLSLILGSLAEVIRDRHLEVAASTRLLTAYRNTLALQDLTLQLRDARLGEDVADHWRIARYDLVQVTRQICDLFVDWIALNKVDFRINAETPVLWVWMDRRKMEFALRTLLSNALKNTFRYGRIVLDLSVVRKEKADKASSRSYCRFSIYDEGLGENESSRLGLKQIADMAATAGIRFTQTTVSGTVLSEVLSSGALSASAPSSGALFSGTFSSEAISSGPIFSDISSGADRELARPREALKGRNRGEWQEPADRKELELDDRKESELDGRKESEPTGCKGMEPGGKEDTQPADGEGTCYTLLIPLGKRHLLERAVEFVEPDGDLVQLNEQQKEEIAELIRVIPHQKVTGKKLLVVDDSDQIRWFLKHLFYKEYEVLEARNGEDGLQTAREQLPDLILCDVMMPLKDGFAVCRELKADPSTRRIPVILLTAKVESEDVITGIECGADDYITKPFDTEVLRSKIRSVLKRSEEMKSYYGSWPGREEKDTPAAVFMESVLRTIEKHLDDSDFEAKVLADDLHMSLPTLYRKIKQYSDYSVLELTRAVRLKKAAELILLQKYSIQEVSERVGFNDPATFRKRFVEQYGVTPSQYAVQERH